MADEIPEPVNETSGRLAEAMSQIKGIPPSWIEAARNGYWHDYVSPLNFPAMALVEHLQILASQPTTSPESAKQIMELMRQVVNGEFDGTKEEADAWFKSPEGRKAMNDLMHGKKRGNPSRPEE
jgi:hypothetical protein